MPLGPPEFARNPADALQCYADLQRTAEDFTNPDFGRLLFFEHRAVTDDEFVAVTRWMRELFTHPDPESRIPTRIYFWPARTIAAVGDHAAQYPLAIERFDLPIRQHVLFFFQRPIVTFVDDLGEFAASAVSCFYDGSRAWVWPWHWQQGRCTPWALAVGDSPGSIDPRYQSTLAWLCAAEAFAAQRLIGAEPITVNRKVRDRVQGRVPDVRVVHLRAVDASRPHRPPLYHIDFGFRFWVRGHQRHLAGREDPIWIAPYLKGPDSQPIKERPTTLFAVTH